MNIDDTVLAEEARSLLAVVRGSCAVRSRSDFVDWLQGEIQEFIPHDVVIVAWGKFETGDITFDIIPSDTRLGRLAIGRDDVRQLLAAAFRRWVALDQEPIKLELASCVGCRDVLHRSAPWLTAVVAHGLKDRRGRYDCLYVFVGRAELASERVRERLRLLLPSIDTGSRQAALSQAQPGAPMLQRRQPAGSEQASSELSAREVEVMGWVRMGKTNAEIALIMDLSTFTIKNHMRRIYKKLDVMNRAQAVGRLGSLVAG